MSRIEYPVILIFLVHLSGYTSMRVVWDRLSVATLTSSFWEAPTIISMGKQGTKEAKRKLVLSD
jgi:hypothetical protein